jgi:phosphatidate cytidylyltransferase
MLLDYILNAAFVWWLLCLIWLFNSKFASENNAINNSIKLFAGLMLLVPSWYAFVSLHSHPDYGPYWALFIMALAWVADSGAYFSGKKWGKNKLAPGISPGKTREGVYGGILFVMLYALLFGWLLDLKGIMLLQLCIICLFVVIFSVVGDLFVSVMKRHAHMKDSGNIFPGHGGVMDRIDSLTAAVPLFVIGLTWMQIAP